MIRMHFSPNKASTRSHRLAHSGSRRTRKASGLAYLCSQVSDQLCQQHGRNLSDQEELQAILQQGAAVGAALYFPAFQACRVTTPWSLLMTHVSMSRFAAYPPFQDRHNHAQVVWANVCRKPRHALQLQLPVHGFKLRPLCETQEDRVRMRLFQRQHGHALFQVLFRGHGRYCVLP